MSRINTNIPSLIAARILTANNEKVNTSLERLSTGLRINRGKDDPAGLIASESLRSEVTAIGAAIENARRADNLVGVAEGSLQEISSLLIDLEGLVDRSANVSGLGADELAANQLQIDSILDTINRIATSTEFGGRKLLNGSLDYSTKDVTTGSTASSISSLQINSARIPDGGSRTVVVEVTTKAETAGLVYTGSATADGSTTLQVAGRHGSELFTFASGTAAADVATAVNQSTSLTGISATVSGTGANTKILFNSTDYGSDAFVSVESVAGGAFTVSGGDSSTRDTGVDVAATVNGTAAIANGLDVSVRNASLSIDMTLASDFATQTADSKSFTITGGGANFSISPTAGLNARASLGIQGLTTGSLGKANIGFLSTLGSGQTNDINSGNFADAQRILRAATKQVAGLRGRLGAFQKNTLASTINSLQVALENTSAAESAIRDTDFAEETSKLTRAQILVSASTSVLQLANQAPQNVLSLLR